MANPVKPKPLYHCLDGYFVFDLVGLNSLVAQRARLAGPEAAPKARRRVPGQLSPCDALACDGPQLSFKSFEQQVGRADNVLAVEYDGAAARRASFGFSYGRGQLQIADAQECRQRISGARNMLA